MKPPCLLAVVLLSASTLTPQGEADGRRAGAQAVDTAKVARLIAAADEVGKEVEELRGKKFKKPVTKGVYTEQQLRGFLEKKLFEEELGGDKLAHYEWMLSDMGFIPKGTDLRKTILDVLLSQVGGFYDPDRGSFFMMEKAADYGESVNRMMIAHELTHALDDQYYHIDPLMKAREAEHDAGFAIGAVVEGSATALMTRWAAEYGVKKYEMLAELKEVAKREAEQAKTLLSAPAYFATIVARYMAGMSFLTRGKGQVALAGRKNGVAAEVAAALEDVPLSSEQILHPEKYWDAAKKDLPVTVSSAGSFEQKLEKRLGAKIVDRDTLGEIHVALLARRPDKKLVMGLMAQASYWTNRGARGWGGDRVFLLDREGAKGIVWFTFWDTDRDAAEFTGAYVKHYGKRVAFDHARTGRVAVFTYGFAGHRAADLLGFALANAGLVKGEVPFPASDG